MTNVLDHELSCGCAACGAAREDGSVDPQAGTVAPNGKTILSAAEAAANLTRTGTSWLLDNYGELDDGILNYAFWSSFEELSASYYSNADGTYVFGEVEKQDKFSIFTTEQMAVAERALALWDDLIDLMFQRTSADQGDINFGNTESSPGSGAYAYLPFGSGLDATYKQDHGIEEVGRVGGDIWINNFLAKNNGAGANGSYMLHTMVHEIGHALGLSHAGDYNASQDLDGDGKPDPITYATHATFVQDSHQYSVMSYFSADKSGASHINWTTLAFILPSTPMVHDVLAAQKLYGADATTRTGDTVYGFNSNADRDAFDFVKTPLPVVTIWDAGGNDTLDLSGFATNSLIDLNPGAFSSGGGTGFLTLDEMKARGLLPASYTEEQYAALKAKYNSTDGLLKDNIAIAYGAIVENGIGGGGNDRIIGNDVANLLVGNAGDDVLQGGAGDDRIEGGAGADELDGGQGSDTLAGGADDDRYLVGEGDVVLELGGEGIDTVSTALLSYTLADAVERLLGTSTTGQELAGNALGNFIAGAEGNDRIAGKDGDDQIEGGGGADSLFGDGGADLIRGGALNDYLSGGHGNDTLSGDDGDDVLTAGEGDDLLDGGLGNDTLHGGLGKDRIGGKDGDDYIDGGEGEDGLFGDGGNDRLRGGTLNDYLSGGTGNDALYGDDGDDFLAGGDGDDYLDGGLGTDQLHGGAGADRIAAKDGDDYLDGGDGADSLFGDAGNDRIRGGALNDYLSGGIGNDALYGDDGDDFLTAGDGDDYLDGGLGTDQLHGGAGVDRLAGKDGDDYLDGGAGDDALYGDAGNDRIRGGTSNDYLSGGTGNDALYGDDGNDSLTAGDGDDYLDGGLGADTIHAGIGNDAVQAGGGADYVDAGAGNDVIHGGAGADVLRGNGGNDVFSYRSLEESQTWAADSILDFARGADLIDLGAIDANIFAVGNQSFAFIGSDDFAGAGSASAGQLRAVNLSGSKWQVQADTDGDGDADFAIDVTVTTIEALTASDFLL